MHQKPIIGTFIERAEGTGRHRIMYQRRKCSGDRCIYLICYMIYADLRSAHTESLLDKHFSKLTDKCYVDHSLHLLAFDLMYCCRTYGYYRGLVAPVTGKTIKKPVEKSASKEELEAAEAERTAKVLALEQELSDLEQKIGDYEEL